MKLKIYLIIFVLSGFNAFSQTVISGKVLQEKGEPLPGANAYLQGTYDGTSANEGGEFSFKTSKSGSYVLIVEFMGYEPFTQKVDLKGDSIFTECEVEGSTPAPPDISQYCSGWLVSICNRHLLVADK